MTTAAAVAAVITSSLLRKRAMRRISGTSISLVAAKMTRAPRAASGKDSRTGPAKSRTMTTAPSATRELTWVRDPAALPSTVREPLEETGKPWNRPVATLAVPSASNS